MCKILFFYHLPIYPDFTELICFNGLNEAVKLLNYFQQKPELMKMFNFFSQK